MSDPFPNSEIILYQTEDGRTRIQCRFENETLWLTQALIGELFEKDVRTINEHLVNIFDEGELRREATIRKFRIVRTEGKREVAREIERFIFLMFRTTTVRANYRSSEFYIAARAMDCGEITAAEIESKLETGLSGLFDAEGFLRITDFHNLLFKKFQSGGGYYSWSGLRYFLYEYELSLLEGARQKKVDWSDLLKTERDRISIEHIYPQTESDAWAEPFAPIPVENLPYYKGTLGNLLLLSASINSALQNESFAAKKHPKEDAEGNKLRNGYSDGSHSEIEVATNESWGPTQIRNRGLRLLNFLAKRWEIEIKDEDREKLLFLSHGE
jgi:hypothetical protein